MEEHPEYVGPHFDEAMRLLGQGDFTPLGRLHWHGILATAAAGRIKLEQYLAEGRPVGEVKNPIFVVGLPRSGTSLVQRLIATDPARRGLRTFEMLSPVPPRKPSLTAKAKRFGFALLSYGIYRVFVPELIRIHHTSPTSLEECWMLFMPTYSVLNADYIFPNPAFGDWLLSRDMSEPFDCYKKLLGILSLSSPETPFVLKSPEHLWFLDDIYKTFPDARVIWTHRDPASAVLSYSAQMCLPARQHRGVVDPRAMGKRVLSRFRQGVERADAAMALFPKGRLAHLQYDELARDPVGALDRVYRELELEASPEHTRKMKDFLAGPQLDKNQNHYLEATYGLEKAQIREHFVDYMQKFDVKA